MKEYDRRVKAGLSTPSDCWLVTYKVGRAQKDHRIVAPTEAKAIAEFIKSVQHDNILSIAKIS